MALASPPTAIADLRRLLQRMESHRPATANSLPFGIADIDSHLPARDCNAVICTKSSRLDRPVRMQHSRLYSQRAYWRGCRARFCGAYAAAIFLLRLWRGSA